MGQGHVLDGPLHVSTKDRPEVRIGRQASIVGSRQEAGKEPITEVGHVAVAGVHGDYVRLVDLECRVRRRSPKDLCPICSEPFHVPRVLTWVREGVIEFGVSQTSGVVSTGQAQECFLATGELVQCRPHRGVILATSCPYIKTFRPLYRLPNRGFDPISRR
jgi:hypothetical protein